MALQAEDIQPIAEAANQAAEAVNGQGLHGRSARQPDQFLNPIYLVGLEKPFCTHC